MISEVGFRLSETKRFLSAVVGSSEGRSFLFSYFVNILVLAFLVMAGVSAVLYALFEGLVFNRRELAFKYSLLVTMLITIPLVTMPFFSFKDVIDRFVQLLTRRRLFTYLSPHVFYRPTINGNISLHLAKAHEILAEKYTIVVAKPQTADKISRQLAISIGHSIRDAVKFSKIQVETGLMRADQQIVGATYGYLFGAAKSKLRLRRRQPSFLSRIFSGVFYRFGALHAVYMYFIINDRLPPSFDPVYFIASVGDVVGSRK